MKNDIKRKVTWEKTGKGNNFTEKSQWKQYHGKRRRGIVSHGK